MNKQPIEIKKQSMDEMKKSVRLAKYQKMINKIKKSR